MAVELSKKQKEEGWQIVRFGEIAKEKKTTTKDPFADGLEYYIGLEHLDSQSLRIQRKGSIAEDNPTFTKRFSPGQILFGRRRAYLKKAAVADFEGICSGDITVIEAIPGKIIPELLPFIVQSDMFFDWAVKNSAGGLSPRVKWKSLADFELPLPPHNVQEELQNSVKEIESYLSKIDTCLDSLWGNLHTICRNLFVNGAKKEKIKKEINSSYSIPASWRVCNIQELSPDKDKVLRTGPYGSSLKGEHWRSKGVPVLTIGSIGDGRVEENELLYIDQEYSNTLRHYKVKSNDIVFSRVADIGRSFLIKESQEGWVISSNLMRIRVDPQKILPKFLYYSILFSPIVLHQLKRFANSGGRLLVNSKILNEILFPVPTVEEQEQFSEISEMLVFMRDERKSKLRKIDSILLHFVLRRMEV